MDYIPQETYDTIIESIPICCVDVVIVNNGKFLLVKRTDEPAKNQWWLPGGRVIKGETLKRCAHRKALDEVGLNCYVGPIVHTDETIFDTGPSNISIHSINVCFLLYPKNNCNDVKLDRHSTLYRWDNGETLEFEAHPYVIKCLKGAGFLSNRP